MALQNPSNLYTAGAVSLNPMPYVNIINQARAKKQAREDAIDQYYRKLPDTLNDKGVRDQDRPVIENYRNKIYEYGIKNKDLLRKGDGASQLEMEKLFREANAAAERSRNLGKRALERGKMYLSKENRWVVDDDEYMAAEDMESKPINDPAHREMDMPALLANKPFDESEFGKEIKGKIKYGTKAVRQTDPTNPLYDIVSEVPNIDSKTAEQIYSFASEKVNGNKRFEKFIKNKTPEQLTELNRVSMKVFGHPIREDFAEEDAAAAYTVLQIPVTSSKEKSQQDIVEVMDRRFKEQKELIGLRGAEARRNQRNQDELIRGRKDVDFNTIGNLSDNVFTQVGKTMIPDRGAYKGQEIRMIFQEDVDPNRWNLLRGYDEGKRQMGIQPDEVRVPDGKGGFTKHKVLYQDPATRDIKGANMRTRSKEAIQDEYVNYVSSTKAKSEMNSKASENTNNQTGQGKGTQKQKINGW